MRHRGTRRDREHYSVGLATFHIPLMLPVYDNSEATIDGQPPREADCGSTGDLFCLPQLRTSLAALAIYPQAIGVDVAQPIRICSTLASQQHPPSSQRLLPVGVLALVVVSLLLIVACDQGSETPTATTASTVSPLATSTPSPLGTATSALEAAAATAVPSAPVARSTAMPPVTFTTGATDTATSTRVPSATATSRPPQAPPAASSPTPVAAMPVLVQPSATQASGSSASHRYVFPVSPASVTTYGQYHHDYPATDIFCPIGSLFVAPTDGVVDFVSIKDVWDPKVDDPATRGGLSVAIIGADGVRYYGSHLSAVESGIMPGVKVAAGQMLGKTGKSGDARFTDSHLHFGISPPTTPTDWETRRGIISPYKYLRAWEAGTQLQPVLP